jgi:ribose transport system permease protein
MRDILRTRPVGVLLLLLLALVGGIEAAFPGTVSFDWVSNGLLFAAPLGILAASQTLVLLTGGIDLSVSAVATVAAYLLATNAAQGNGPAIALAVGAGLVIGLLNGVGVALFFVQPLVMTLGTALMAGGLLTIYAQTAVARLPHIPAFIQVLGAGKIAGYVPVDLLLWAPLTAAIAVGLARTGFGRLLYAVGDNREACRLAGVRVWQVLLAAYTLAGLLAALAGLVLVGSTNAADLGLANVYLLPSVAAAIVGGTSIFGGRGGYGGSVVGTLILTALNSLLTLLDAPEPFKQVLYGVIILALAAAYARLAE